VNTLLPKLRHLPNVTIQSEHAPNAMVIAICHGLVDLSTIQSTETDKFASTDPGAGSSLRDAGFPNRTFSFLYRETS
jgi:hypothetical protein